MRTGSAWCVMSVSYRHKLPLNGPDKNFCPAKQGFNSNKFDSSDRRMLARSIFDAD